MRHERKERRGSGASPVTDERRSDRGCSVVRMQWLFGVSDSVVIAAVAVLIPSVAAMLLGAGMDRRGGVVAVVAAVPPMAVPVVVPVVVVVAGAVHVLPVVPDLRGTRPDLAASVVAVSVERAVSRGRRGRVVGRSMARPLALRGAR